MKHEKYLSALVNCLLSVAIAMGGVGCMVTGLHLEVENMGGVFLACAITAALCCVSTFWRWGPLALLAVAALVGGYLWREGTLLLQLESTVYHISLMYDAAYGWGVADWTGTLMTGVPTDMGLGFIACLCAAVICLNLCVRGGAIVSALVGFLPLATCMVVTDSVPDAKYLFLLLTAQLLMIITNTVRRRSRADGMRLTALLLIPAVLATTLVFHAAPQDGYQASLTDVREQLFDWLRSLPFVAEAPNGQLVLGFDEIIEDKVDLSGVGPKNQYHYDVMDVISDAGGTLYLRGQSFDVYDGTSWEASDNDGYDALGWPDADQLVSAGTVTVTTRSAKALRYMPYYPAGTDWQAEFSQGKLKNPGREKTYTFDRMVLAVHEATPLPTPRVLAVDKLHYLKLPADTANAARKLLPDSLFEDFYYPLVSQQAEAIANLVSGSARYSLNADKMPRGEEDFALWFLENADTGYCVHFATAATVLLRSAGIPARYVTGYAVNVRAGEEVTVTAAQAHAWVEYYDSDRLCWVILDPTPSGGNSTNPGPVGTPDVDLPRPTTPKPTVSTQPSDVTEPVTEPTDATEPVTEPTDATEPVTDPTLSTDPAVTDPPDGDVTPDGPDKKTDIAPVLLWIGSILAVVAAIWLQYLLRRQLRKKQLRSGRANAKALVMWREALRYCRILDLEPPEALLTLAEKAKYSQHTLCGDELAEFERWLDQAKTALGKKPLPIRIFWMLALAVE